MRLLFALLPLAIIFLYSSVVQGAENQEGFVPHLLRVEISNTTPSTNDEIEITYYWKNIGTSCAINNMLVAVHFRNGVTGFFNPDGGCWIASNVFQADYFPDIPTTNWKPGKLIVEKHKVKVSGANGEIDLGKYKICLAMYDRGGRIPLAISNKAIFSATEPWPNYDIGEIEVVADKKTVSPAVLTLDGTFGNVCNVAPDSEPNKLLLPATNSLATDLPKWVGEPVTIGNKEIAVVLDKARNYALAGIVIDGTVFESAGKFPAIAIYDKDANRHELFSDDLRWKVKAVKSKKSIDLTYTCDGFEMNVSYKVDSEINISVKPGKEDKYKALMLSGGGSIFNLPVDKENRDSAVLVNPYMGGRAIMFPKNLEAVKKKIETAWQSWMYPANFIAYCYNGKGLIVRCPQFGSQWSFGFGDAGGRLSLIGDFSQAFRPCPNYFEMPRPEEYIELQIIPVRKDCNGDGQLNWVDIGGVYRDKFIPRNYKLDSKLRDSICGKIDMADPYGPTILDYSELIKQIGDVNFAPQVWWILGAHVPKDCRFETTSYSDKPLDWHNGPNGYDYFQFKKDAAKIGTRIGIHELFQEIAIGMSDFAIVPKKVDLMGFPQRTWGGVHKGKYWQSFALALNVMLKDGSFLNRLNEHFQKWDVRSGDTWHWDCITAVGGRQDYSPFHPATNGTDFRDCLEILKYISEKDIYFTSEGLQEGMHQYCSFAWATQVDFPYAPCSIPLLPVLFQGRTYYSHSWYPAFSLFLGGKPGYEKPTLDKNTLLQLYFGHNVFYSLIADRTVKNMVKTDNGWNVEYNEGGSLTVDFANMTSAMTFVLEVDGKTYTPDNPPASPFGVAAKRVNGIYEISSGIKAN